MINMKYISSIFVLLFSFTAAVPLYSKNESVHLAAEKNDIPAIKIMIENGKDFAAANEEGKTPLQIAREKGSKDTALFLSSLKKIRYASGSTYTGQVKDEKENGWGILRFFNGSRYSGQFKDGKFHGLGYWYYSNGKGYAGEFRNNQFFGRNELFEDKKVHKPDNYGETLLYQAARRGSLTQVRLIIERGGDVNLRSNQKQTPLHFAAFEGYLSVAKVLLKYNAEISPVDRDGMTPLHFAADSGKTAMVRLLIEKGALVNARNKLGVTPLMHAVFRDSDEVVKILLEAGAEVSARDLNRRRAVDHARILKSYRCLRLLRKATR